MRRRPLPTLWALGLALVAAGCGSEEAAYPGIPMADLTAQGKAPVEVLALSGSMVSPAGASAYQVRVKNVSDRKISGISWKAVGFDGEGKRLAGEPADVPMDPGLSPMAPGDELEGGLMIPVEGAGRLRLVAAEVVYLEMNPLNDKTIGELPKKWKNPNLEAQLAAAKP